MKTYKLTFKLTSPLSVSFPKLPTLDGILSYGYVKEIYRNIDFREKYIKNVTNKYNKKHIEFVKNLQITNHIPQKLNYPDDELFDFSFLPICKKNDYFLASSMIFPSFPLEKFGFIRKKFDSFRARYTSMNKNIRISSGPTKNIQIEMPLRILPDIHFYVATNNIKKLLHLMSHIKGLGKKRNIQYGSFNSINYTEIKNFDWSIINRPIPKKYVTEEMHSKTIISGVGLGLFYLSYKPNYFLSEPTMCYLPLI